MEIKKDGYHVQGIKNDSGEYVKKFGSGVDFETWNKPILGGPTGLLSINHKA